MTTHVKHSNDTVSAGSPPPELESAERAIHLKEAGHQTAPTRSAPSSESTLCVLITNFKVEVEGEK